MEPARGRCAEQAEGRRIEGHEGRGGQWCKIGDECDKAWNKGVISADTKRDGMGCQCISL